MKIILLPLSWIYGSIMWIRNRLFDMGVLQSNSFKIPVVSVGNLRVGGTGKTPMIECLIRTLAPEYKIAVVSRGYGRETNGCIEVKADSHSRDCGDESVQVKRHFPDIKVVVSEKRSVGIEYVLEQHPDVNLVLLDDAFQHRSVKPYINLLLTAFERPFSSDYPFPSGRLREFRSAYKRADMLIVSRTPLEVADGLAWLEGYNAIPNYPAHTVYVPIDASKVYGFSALANNDVFERYLRTSYELTGFSGFADHYAFSTQDLRKLQEQAGGVQLVCTAKDWAKIKDIEPGFDVKVIEIKTEIPQGLEFWIKNKLNAFEG